MEASVATQHRIVVNRRGAARLRGGHVWVYRSDVVSVDSVRAETSPTDSETTPGSESRTDKSGAAALHGCVVGVQDELGKSLGSALYSSASQIAVRMIADGPVNEEEWATLLRARIRTAVDFRRAVVRDSEACRIVFGEADLIPGLIVDRYNDLVSFQILTQAMDREDARAAVIGELVEQISPAAIVERVDGRIRELEELPPRPSGAVYGEKTNTEFSMNSVRFHYDALSGQKTGAFLDQRENYAAAAAYAHGEALDVFCYQGGFALHLARVCPQVTGVDSSRAALEIADKNAALNGSEIEWIEANAFDLMKDYAAAGRQYDTIVLDPPAFAKTRRALPTALRGYKELNLRALKMLRPGGVLVTCSCSYHVSEAEFLEMLAAAAADAHRRVRVLEKRGQAKDHPVLLGVPETAYLKCVIASVL